MAVSLTYGEYLKLDELLKLQAPKTDPAEHDELLFIVIHQTYELWFKQMLHELDHMLQLLAKDELTRAHHTLRRVVTIQKVLVHQFDILETLTPAEFLSFRDRLETASGFQSAQFRAFEFAMGYKRHDVLRSFENNRMEHENLLKRFNAPTVWDAVLGFIDARGFEIPREVLTRDLREPVTAHQDVQKALLRIGSDDAALFDYLESLTELDEGIQEWRYRHVKMVERVIGSKMGTGGSSGVEYLRGTLFKPFFPDLWEIRSQIGAR